MIFSTKNLKLSILLTACLAGTNSFAVKTSNRFYKTSNPKLSIFDTSLIVTAGIGASVIMNQVMHAVWESLQSTTPSSRPPFKPKFQDFTPEIKELAEKARIQATQAVLQEEQRLEIEKLIQERAKAKLIDFCTDPEQSVQDAIKTEEAKRFMPYHALSKSEIMASKK